MTRALFRVHLRRGSDGCNHLLPSRVVLTKAGQAVIGGDRGRRARWDLLRALCRRERAEIGWRHCSALVVVGATGAHYGTPGRMYRYQAEAERHWPGQTGCNP